MAKKERIFPLNTFGGRIQDLRKNRLKFTRPEFYDLIYSNENVANESKSRTVKNWESGDCEPDLKTISKICTILKCSSDYLLGVDNCTTKDTQFIHDYTGLSEDAINALAFHCTLGLNPIIESVNILISDTRYRSPQNHRRPFIELFSNYIRFSKNSKKTYSLNESGNVAEARPSNIVEGIPFYNSNNIYFSSEQLEQMFIMEMEDIIKNLKSEAQKALDTN